MLLPQQDITYPVSFCVGDKKMTLRPQYRGDRLYWYLCLKAKGKYRTLYWGRSLDANTFSSRLTELLRKVS